MVSVFFVKSAVASANSSSAASELALNFKNTIQTFVCCFSRSKFSSSSFMFFYSTVITILGVSQIGLSSFIISDCFVSLTFALANQSINFVDNFFHSITISHLSSSCQKTTANNEINNCQLTFNELSSGKKSVQFSKNFFH